MGKNYYEILGVNKNDSDETIKKAYRKMALKYHPDRNPGDSDAELKFKEAASAYEVLSNPEKKANYDRFGDENGSMGFGNINVEDIFSHFGDIFGGFGSGFNHSRTSRGSNLRLKVELSIEDILNGSNKKIKYKRHIKCDHCDGKGGHDVRTCPDCNGTGQKVSVVNGFFGQARQVSTCQRCHGSGEIPLKLCNICNGSGVSTKEEIVEVDIPAGVSDGMQLTMKGYGNYIKNGQYGDLLIIVEEIKYEYFKRERNNIIINKTISVIDAMIGNNIIIDSPNGKIDLKIEPGTEHGKIYQIENKGIPDINYGLGDLFIDISIKIPSITDNVEKDILKKLETLESFK